MKKSLLEKLVILLPHWVAHNRSHASEFAVWAAKAVEAGLPPQTVEALQEASHKMQAVEHCLEALALSLGMEVSKLPEDGGQHHHSHGK